MVSMLPKTAENFRKLKKGLYLNPLKGYPYDLKEEAFARSLNILDTYGEIMPLVASLKKKPKKSKKKRLSEECDMSSKDGYMQVIRDSESTLKNKEFMEK